mgnify:CR=1 FL=1
MEGRREWPVEDRYRMVLQVLSREKSAVEVCRENQISQNLFYKWRDQFLAGAQVGLKDRRLKANKDPLAEENRQLKRLVGEYALIIDAQKKLCILGSGETR